MTPHEKALEAAYKARFNYTEKGDDLEHCIKAYITTVLDSPEMDEVREALNHACGDWGASDIVQIKSSRALAKLDCWRGV